MLFSRETINHTTEAEWLASRRVDLTSTECAALFGASPYATKFELHHIKAGTLDAKPFDDNSRIVWGRRLEAAIAYGVAEDLGLIVVPFKSYMRIPELRMGSSFDFKIIGVTDFFSGDETARNMFRQHGDGLMECKNVDGLQFRRGWLDDGETIEAPAHIEFQAQHQLEVADLGWSIIAPLVGGNTPRPIIRERDRTVGEAIRLEVAEFWNRVDHGTPPDPDFANDKDTIARMFVDNDGSEIDLTSSNRLAELCMQRKAASDQIKNAETAKDAATAEILTIIGPARRAYAAGGYKISASTIPAAFMNYEKPMHRRVHISQKKI